MRVKGVLIVLLLVGLFSCVGGVYGLGSTSTVGQQGLFWQRVGSGLGWLTLAGVVGSVVGLWVIGTAAVYKSVFKDKGEVV